MSVIGLVPARGGSKGIPEKNIALCAGRPLLAYTADAAAKSKLLTRTILSTDSVKIAEVGKKLGLQVPFDRPATHSDDQAPMIAVLAHALDWLEKSGETFEAIVLLQPTSPFRTARHIDEAIELFRSSKADTLVSIVRVPHSFHPTSVLDRSSDGSVQSHMKGDTAPLRRQDKSELFARNGPAILILRPEVIRGGNLYSGKTVGYLMDSASSIDIDGPEDLKMAEALIEGLKNS